MSYKRSLLCVLAGVAVLALPTAEAAARSKAKTVHRTINVKTARDYWRFHKMTSFASFTIVDLRPNKQFLRGRIPGAKNIVADKRIRFRLRKLSKKRAVMIYCRDGKTGKRILALMKKLRFKEVYNIADGIIAWKRKKYPLKRGTGSD